LRLLYYQTFNFVVSESIVEALSSVRQNCLFAVPWHKHHFQLIQVLLILVVGCTMALAQDQSTSEVDWSPRLDFSGFGTLGYAVIDNDTARFRVGNGLDGATSSGSLTLDSRIALQLDTEISRFLSGTIQLLSKENEKGDFDPRLEWAFLKYRASQFFTLRGGILSMPLFKLSDSRQVAYATPYLRPPQDLYQQISLSSFEGADFLNFFILDDWIINTQVFYGSSEFKIPGDFRGHFSGGGFNTSAESDFGQFRFSYILGDGYVESPTLDQVFNGLQQVEQSFPALTDQISEFELGTKGNEAKTNWIALGMGLDFDRFFIDAEYVYFKTDGWAGDTSSWYIAGGYRFGNFIPYALLSATRTLVDSNNVDLPDTSELAPLKEAIDQLAADRSQNSVAVGMRWDFALKRTRELAFKTISVALLKTTAKT